MATVTIGTPYPITWQRLFPDPDLVSGNIIEWANVVGGVEANVEVFTDARYSVALSVTSFDWRVYDGVEWGAWATETIADATNAYEYALTATIQSSTDLPPETGTMNQNEFSMVSSATFSSTLSEEYGVGAFNQHEYELTTAISVVSSLSGDEGDVTLNEFEFYFSSAIQTTTNLTNSEGNSGGAQFMEGVLKVRPFEFIPSQESRFLPRNPLLVGDLLPGSSNQMGIKLVSEQAGVESDADLTNVTQVRIVIGGRYLIEQVQGSLPAYIEWGAGDPGVLFINPQAILMTGFNPGTYSLRVEVFVGGEPDYFVFPSEGDSYIKLSL